jgi:CRP-like cAMP-binding protein
VYLDGDAMMLAGEMGREMFIIEKGYAAVTSADRQTIYAKLKAGDYAGESSLLESKPRLASVFAIGYVDTYFITSENFNKVRKLRSVSLASELFTHLFGHL